MKTNSHTYMKEHDPTARQGEGETKRQFSARIQRAATEHGIALACAKRELHYHRITALSKHPDIDKRGSSAFEEMREINLDILIARDSGIHAYRLANDPYYAEAVANRHKREADMQRRKIERMRIADQKKADKRDAALQRKKARDALLADRAAERERLRIKREGVAAEERVRRETEARLAASARRHGRTPPSAIRKRRPSPSSAAKATATQPKSRLTPLERAAVKERLDRIARAQVESGLQRRAERAARLAQDTDQQRNGQ
ncbi:hypothetical protein PLUTO_00600 [Luteibacter phage vB_LflM-Pluto]|uniref:Uncharacterized protein n=1 Tax=Luteibacter phage vB_LflM-Pluto TaxID=2948611 RepID=A0A9E7SLZ3_9CAUD|nr:hypothetical protein PLUTO_00600 [Luteibacter phage vB_LflM-Pluto]